MTVSAITPVNNYTGNNSATTFDFDFLIQNQDELEVLLTDSNGIITTLILGVDYSINEIGNENGSYITFPLQTSSFGILKDDETITLSLILPIKQESEFENSANLDLGILESTFDYIVRVLQILSRKIDRCVKTNEGIDISPDSIIENLNDSVKIAVDASLSAVNAKDVVVEKEEYINDKSEEFVKLSEKTINDIQNLGIDSRSKIDLSNLNVTGEKHFLNKTQISNCVLEFPENIKYEYLGNELVIKSGSKLTIPAGVGVFKEYLLKTDIVLNSENFDSKCFVLINENNSVAFLNVENSFSGDTEPSVSTTNALWYDTASNSVKITTDSGTTWTANNWSLPIGIFNKSSDNIEQLFNGFGYIGSSLWVDKGIKVLIPNGKNFNGTLKNIEVVTSKLQMLTALVDKTAPVYITIDELGNISECANEMSLFAQDEEPASTSNSIVWFSPQNNISKEITTSNPNWTVITKVFPFSYTSNSIRIVSFDVTNCFRIVDYKNYIDNNFVSKNNLAPIMPDYSSGISQSLSTNYTASCDGVILFHVSDYNTTSTLVINGTSYKVQVLSSNQLSSAFCSVPIPKGTVYNLTQGRTYSVQYLYFFPLKGAN